MGSYYLIGLTGNLGTGKSTVRRMLEIKGARGIDADKLAHAAMTRGSPTWSRIVDTFGDGILRADGKIDRRKLGAQVFSDPEQLYRLEAIVHPAVRALIRASLSHVTSGVVVLEAIKLVQANLHLECDALWVVVAAPEIQIERVARDRQITPQAARARLSAQGPQDALVRLADVVIDNSGGLDATGIQVEQAWERSVRPGQGRAGPRWRLDADSESGALPLSEEPAVGAEPAGLKPDENAPTESGEAPVFDSEPATPATTSGIANGPEVSLAPGITTELPAMPAPTLDAEPPGSTERPVRGQDELAAASTETRVTQARETPGAGVTPHAIATILKQAQAAASAPIARESIQVRRARRSDLSILAAALAQGMGVESVSHSEALRRFGERGYRIAVFDNRVIALVAWEAENLVAIVRETWSESEQVAPLALPPLLALVEEDARALQCEVSAILLAPQTPAFMIAQIGSEHYQRRDLNSLHRSWRQVVDERRREGDGIWVKRLRDDMVVKPV